MRSTSRTCFVASAALAFACAAACGSASKPPPAADETGGVELSEIPGPNCADPNAPDLQGCGCGTPQRPCFTGNPNLRNHPGCSDGTQVCTKDGEFSSWGACTGDVTSCAPPNDGPGTGCCLPGATRWCDTPVACTWGKQDCTPNSTWGRCAETTDIPPGCAVPPNVGFYDEACCVHAGQCCQDILRRAGGPTSIGSCDQLACPSDYTPPK
jgi:hypothetical protein